MAHHPQSPPKEKRQLRDWITTQSRLLQESWIGLARALIQVHQEELWDEWGYRSFDQYVIDEVGLNLAEAKRRMASLGFVERYLPDMLQRADEVAGELLDLDLVDELRKAQKSHGLSEEKIDKLSKDIFDSDRPKSERHDQLEQALPPKPPPAPPPPSRVASRIVASAKSILDDLAYLPDVPKALRDMVAALVKALEELAKGVEEAGSRAASPGASAYSRRRK
jgi:hypothetical protein